MSDFSFKPIKFNPSELEFHASCQEGLDQFLYEEIKSFGLKIISSNRGGIYFETNRPSKLSNFILNTRFSSRVSFSIIKFVAESPDELYEKAKSLPWEKIFPYKCSFKIDSTTKDILKHSQFALYRLKDSIRDRLRESNREDVSIERDSPDMVILLRSSQNFVNIQISISSEPFHKRGYRLETVSAPIKETTAQALIEFSGWNGKDVLIDPMCGSGTILIEAALLVKKEFLNHYLIFKSKVYSMLFDEIPKNKINPDAEKIFYGFDIDKKAIEIAKENARRAGVDDLIHFEEMDVLNFTRDENLNKGFLVFNPPYGERLGEEEALKEFYFKLGELFKKEFKGFKITLVCGNKSLLGHLKLKESNSMNLSIAKLKAKFVNYEIHG